MKAAFIEQYGGPEVLKYPPRQRPALGRRRTPAHGVCAVRRVLGFVRLRRRRIFRRRLRPWIFRRRRFVGRRRRVGELVMQLTQEDRAAIAPAIR